MSFLQPILLFGLPLALLPVIIHLINQHRHRTVRWAAMMFLLDAKKMTKGLARLRQILILAMRVLAIAALVFAASRPLAGGWLGLVGGTADTLLVLLDRSASMEQQNLETGESKRAAALDRIADLIETTGHRSEIVLIDSATLTPVSLTSAQSLRDLPESADTSTSADIPALLRKAIDHLAANASGRTDIWLASDLRQADWRPGAGEWEAIRADLVARETVRLFLLAFPDLGDDNASIAVRDVKRQRSPQGQRLLMDLIIRRQGSAIETNNTSIPVEITLNGTRTVENFTVDGPELVLLGHSLPLGEDDERGWGRLDLPADDNPADNSAYFVFDEPAPRRTVVLSDDVTTAEAIRAAASASTEPGVTYEANVFGTDAIAQIPWADTALLFWQAPLPFPGTPEATLLKQHVAAGRSLILLPPPDDGGGVLFGVEWKDWAGSGEQPFVVDWWRTETGLLANTRSGAPLPVSEVGIFRTRRFEGSDLPLMKVKDDLTVVARVLTEPDVNGDAGMSGTVHVWGTLPRPDHSALASEGVVFFVMLHRSLDAGAAAVSRARALGTGLGVLSGFRGVGSLETVSDESPLAAPGLRSGAFEFGENVESRGLLALNRPEVEDDPRVLSPEALKPLLAGVDYRRIDDAVGSGSSLAAEIWRAFLVAMALALLAEAILCLPPRPEDENAHPSPVVRRAGP